MIPASDPATGQHPYRWVVLTLSWAALTMTAVDRATWGPAAASIGQHLGVSLSGLGVFVTGYFIGHAVSSAAGGVLNDWLSPRLVISVTVFLSGGFMVLFGETNSVGLGIALQGAVGIFAGCNYSSGIKLISQWFAPHNYGFAMGVFLTGTSLGTVIANAVVPSLIETSSWRTSYHVFGAGTMIVAVLCFILLRNRNHPVETERAVPNLRPLASNRDLWLIALAGFGGVWATIGFSTWANILMIKGSHITPVQAGGVVVVFAIVAVIAKPVIGVVSDLLFGGRGKTLTVVVLAGFVVALLVFGTRDSLTGFLWTAPFLGITAFVYSPLMVSMTPKIVGVRLAGSASGATYAVWQIANIFGPLAVGAVFQATHSFFWACATLAAGPFLGALAMLAVREGNEAPEGSDTRKVAAGAR